MKTTNVLVEQRPVRRSFKSETGVQFSPRIPNDASTDGSDSWLRTMMGKFNSFWRYQRIWCEAPEHSAAGAKILKAG